MHKAKSYTKGNVPYELTLQNYSSISILGEFNVLENLNAQICAFESIPQNKGFISIVLFLSIMI